ncbi:MAG: hypothetical protein V2A65_08040 [Candidatus Omnitrophota bacterium]
MYSPKISEELVPDLYRIAKAKHLRMTSLVNDIIFRAIKDIRVETRIVSKTAEIREEVFTISEQAQEA